METEPRPLREAIRPRGQRPLRDQVTFVVEGSVSPSRLTILATGIVLGLGILGAVVVLLLARYFGL